MRIISGEWGGRTLHAPKGSDTRPTSDALRGAIFNILEHGIGHAPARAMDLFAGTGALGLEALSRGAQSCVFVESDAKALAALRKNIDSLGLGSDRAYVLEESRIERWASWFKKEGARMGPFDTVFCDPPYGKGLVGKALRSLTQLQAPFAADAWLVAEVSTRDEPEDLPGWELKDQRERGTTRLLFYRRVG